VHRRYIPSAWHFVGNDVVIKLKSMKGEHLTIEHEFHVYKKLGCGIGTPCVHWFGTKASFNAILIDSLGQSLKAPLFLVQCSNCSAPSMPVNK
jgi:hypothetical protein